MNTLDLPLLVLLFFLFFSYAVVTLQFIFPISALFIVSLLIYVKITKTIIISKDDLFWLSCTTVNFVGLIRTPNFSSAILFTGFLLIFVLLKIYLSMMTNWTSFFIRTSLVFSSVHVVSTITQYFIPGFIQALNQIILPSAAYSVNMYQLKVSKYAGITGQVGANSFYITIFLAVIFSSLMIKKRRFLLVLIFMLGFIALLLTTKRGLLLFNSIAILYLFFLVNLGRSKKNKKAIVISLILLVTISVFSAAIYLISNPSIATKILVDDDITSGRIGIYLLVFELIKKAPFIGNGLSSVEEFVGIKAHNIYLQLWAELGIAGLFLYTTAMLFTLKKTIQTYSIVNYVKIEKLKILVLVSIYIQIVFILYGFTGNGLYDYFMIGTYMIAIALPGSANLILTKLRY